VSNFKYLGVLYIPNEIVLDNRTPNVRYTERNRALKGRQMAEEAEKKEKMVTIVVNGTAFEVPKKEDITYVEVVTLAYPDYPQHPEITYSVTYTRGDGHKPEGILSPGESVKVKEGMAFNVIRTGQS
jgi:hypothetical protein